MAICNLFAPLLSPSIYVGDTGTVFVLTAVNQRNIPVNINAASRLEITLTMSTGIVLERVGAISTNGVDGRFQYTTLASDLLIPGTWVIQGQATVGTAMWSTKSSWFFVLPLGK